MRTSADTFPVVGGRCTGRARRCKAKQGRREDGADVWIPTYTVVRFLGRVKGWKRFFWKPGAHYQPICRLRSWELQSRCKAGQGRYIKTAPTYECLLPH
jgi:hypothetical protein